MMIKIVTPIPSSDGSNMRPQAILAPAFPTPSPSGLRSSSPIAVKKRNYTSHTPGNIKLHLISIMYIYFWLPACITRVLRRMFVSPSNSDGRGECSNFISTVASPFSSATRLFKSPICESFKGSAAIALSKESFSPIKCNHQTFIIE